MHLEIHPLEGLDIEPIAAVLRTPGRGKTRAQYELYLSYKWRQLRTGFVAFAEGEYAGYSTFNWSTGYTPF